MHEHAHHAKERWVSWVALTSALLAAFAAITALLAGHHENEAMVEQIHASDQWSYYQAKGIKAAVLGSKLELLSALGKEVSEKDQEKLAKYKEEQEEIAKDAKEKEHGSEGHLQHHVIFARGVTFFQIAIAVAAIAVLSKRRKFLAIALAMGLTGIVFLVQGLLL